MFGHRFDSGRLHTAPHRGNNLASDQYATTRHWLSYFQSTRPCINALCFDGDPKCRLSRWRSIRVLPGFYRVLLVEKTATCIYFPCFGSSFFYFFFCNAVLVRLPQVFVFSFSEFCWMGFSINHTKNKTVWSPN
jgi:hypothetical protein